MTERLYGTIHLDQSERYRWQHLFYSPFTTASHPCRKQAFNKFAGQSVLLREPVSVIGIFRQSRANLNNLRTLIVVATESSSTEKITSTGPSPSNNISRCLEIISAIIPIRGQ